MTTNTYNAYLDESLSRLLKCIKEMQCRPILFIGSGLSLRYMNAPTWKGLLSAIIEENSLLEKPIEYYIMKSKEGGIDNLPKVAGQLVPYYFDYAWQKESKPPIK